MAATHGSDHPELSELLLAQGHRFDFYQAVRLLHLLSPGAVPVGEGDDPRREAVRFVSDVSLAFPASEVKSIEPLGDDGAPARLTVTFMGVATPASFGSLPTPYVELVLSRLRERDPALRDFLDIFNHRLVSLFYRAWARSQLPVVHERGGPDGGIFERALLALLGLGLPSLADALPLDARSLLSRAPALRRGRVTVAALEELLADIFDVPVVVEQFIPEWYTMDTTERTALGRGNCGLGTEATLGERVPIAQSRFRLRIGPLTWDRFQSLLPPGDAFGPLVELTRLAVGPELDFDLALCLAPTRAPGLRLGIADGQGSSWLGWSTWLTSVDAAATVAEVIVDADARRAGAAA